MTLNVGDRVKLTQRGFELNRDILGAGSEGTIVAYWDDNYPYVVLFDELQVEQPCGPDEIEPVKPKIPVGTRVRCTNQSSYRGKLGTIVDNSGNWEFGYISTYLIEWDGQPKHNGDSQDNHNGGIWGEGSFEIYEEPNSSLREAVELSAMIFEHYSKLHFAKDATPENWMKGITNLGFAAIMKNALNSSE